MVGEEIRWLRQQRGVSLDEVASELVLSIDFLRELEKCNYKALPSKTYSLGYLENLLEYLGVPKQEKQVWLNKLEKEFERIDEGNLSNPNEEKSQEAVVKSSQEEKEPSEQTDNNGQDLVVNYQKEKDEETRVNHRGEPANFSKEAGNTVADGFETEDGRIDDGLQSDDFVERQPKTNFFEETSNPQKQLFSSKSNSKASFDSRLMKREAEKEKDENTSTIRHRSKYTGRVRKLENSNKNDKNDPKEVDKKDHFFGDDKPISSIDLLSLAKSGVLKKYPSQVREEPVEKDPYKNGSNDDQSDDLEKTFFSRVLERLKNQSVSLGFAIFLFLGLIVWYSAYQLSVNTISSKQLQVLSGQVELSVNENNYSLFDRFDTFPLKENDIVQIFFSDKKINFHLLRISNDYVSFDVGRFKASTLTIREKIAMDLDNDGENELILKYQKKGDNHVMIYFETIPKQSEETDLSVYWREREKVKVGKSFTLIEEATPQLISFYVRATSLPIYLSYNVDGRKQNSFSLDPNTDVLITAENHLEIQIGNYLSGIYLLNKRHIDLKIEGSRKFSVTKIIKWLPSSINETRSDLIIQDYAE